MSKVIIVQVGWAAKSNKSWIAANGGTGDRPGTTLNISENTSEQNRSGKVTYTQAESGNRVVVNVSQEGKEAPAPKYTYTIRTNEPGTEFLVYKGEEGSGDFVEVERVTASMATGGKYVATFETEEANGRYRVKPLKNVVGIDITGFNFSGSSNTSFTENESASTASFDLRPDDSHTKQAIISTTGWTATSSAFNASREIEINSMISNRVWGDSAVSPIYSAECFQAEGEEEPQCGPASGDSHIDGLDAFGKFNIGVPTMSIAGKVFAKNGKFTADIEYKNTDAFKYAASTHLLLNVNVFAASEGSRYYGFRVRRDDPVVDKMLSNGCRPEFTWTNTGGNNRSAEASMMKDDKYAYWVICIENEDDFPDSSGVHYQYCGTYLSADTNSVSFEKNGGKTMVSVSACSIETEGIIPTNNYWSGSEVDTGKTNDETSFLSLDFACDVLSGYGNVTVTETQGDFKWNGGSSSGSVLVEVGENKTESEVADVLRLVNGGRDVDCTGSFDIAFTQAKGSAESAKWYWAFRITKPAGVTATSVPHVVVENESGTEVFNEQWVHIGERIQVGETRVPAGAPAPGPYTIIIDGFEDSVIETSESSVGFENGISGITLNNSTTPPTFTVGRRGYTTPTVKTITVSADCKMIGNVDGEIQPSTDPNAATDVPLEVTASCDEWKAQVMSASDKDWLSISKNGDNLTLNCIREYDDYREAEWENKIVEITCSCNTGVVFETAKYITVYRDGTPYNGVFFVSGSSDFYNDYVYQPQSAYAERRQRYLFAPTQSSPFDFTFGGDSATTLIPAVPYYDDLKMFPNVIFSDASAGGVDYRYVDKNDKLHMYDVVYYENGVLYHSIDRLEDNTITNNPGSAWSALNRAVGSGGNGLTFTVSTGNGAVNMEMGGFSTSLALSTDVLNGRVAGAIRYGVFETGNHAKCFNVNYEIGAIPGGVWPYWIPMFLRVSDYDVVVNDQHLSSDGTGIVEIVTIDGVEYYLIHDYSKVTVTPKDNNGEG